MTHAEQRLPAGPSGGLHLNRRATSRADWSERDLTVLRLLAEGQGTAAIADALAYSESTIKNMVHGLVHRLGARNRTHAVALAIRRGII